METDLQSHSMTSTIRVPQQFISAKSVYDAKRKAQTRKHFTKKSTSKIKNKRLKKKIPNSLDESFDEDEDEDNSKHDVSIVYPSESNTISEDSAAETSASNLSVEEEKGDSTLPIEVNSHEESGYLTSDNLDYVIINPTDVVLFIPFQTCFYIKGRINITIVSGSAEILGSTMNEDIGKTHKVFSPRGYSLLCIRSVNKKWPFNKSIFPFLQKKGLEHDEMWLKLKTKSSICVLLQNLDCKFVDYINRLFPSNVLRCELCAPPVWNPDQRKSFEELCSKLDTSIILRGAIFNARFYQQPDIWQDYTQKLANKYIEKEYIRLLVCGGKGVGKSTFLRYTVNRLLTDCGQVLLLDFDPGQPEFVPSGFVSAILVSEPILGPNFTHLQKPLEAHFVGDVDVTVNPNHYVHCCMQLVNFCRMQPSLSSMPMIINTMGFTSGVGLDLTLDIIRLSQPNHIVQLSSRSSRRNFSCLLDHEHIRENPRGWLTNPATSDLPEYQLDAFFSAAEDSRNVEEWGFRASELRKLGLVSYFSQLSTSPEWTLTDAVPYKISWSNLSVYVAHESVSPDLTMAALNSSLVALCELDAETASSVPRYQCPGFPTVLKAMPVMSSVGYGVVRGIDYQRRLIYLVTPEAADRLSQVNCLVMGGIHLPESMQLDVPASLRSQGGVYQSKVRVPYATFGPSALEPSCIPFKKYNPLFTVRRWNQV